MLMDRYEIIGDLSAGGFGNVMLGEDIRLSRKVAIKKMACSPETKNEMLLLKSFKCEAMAEVYDYQEDGEAAYLIMEYVDGVTLREYLRENGAMSENETLKRIKELINVLKVLHSASPAVIYRDLKPENVMLTGDGRIKLIDFGAAFANLYGEEKNEGAFGTRGYSAPELWRGKTAKVTADIYSLGALMYEMLTGVSPREAPYVRKRLKNVDPAISRGMQRVIDRCLMEEPEERYHSVEELWRAILRRNSMDRFENLVWNMKKVIVVMGYLVALFGILNPLVTKGVNLIDLRDIQKALIFLAVALILHMVLIYRGIYVNQRTRVMKEIFLTEKGYVGLYMGLMATIGMILALGLLDAGGETGRAYAREAPKDMWVEMKDTSERFMLLKNNGVYEVEDMVRLEIPKDSIPAGKTDIRIVATDGSGQEYVSRIFSVQKQD